jgi:tail tube protein
MASTGFGITITFASGFCAEIIDCTPPEMTRDEIETSHTTTPDGAKTYIMSDLIDYGELSVDLNFDETETPPIDQPFEAAVLTFGSGATWSGQMALKSYAPAAPIDDRMTATCVLKVSGKITIAA